MKENKRLNKGITLIALIVTIVIMLILAGVTINVTVDGGLFGKAQSANDSAKLASEREIIQKASIYAKEKSRTGKLTIEELQKELDKITKEKITLVLDNGDTIVVKFKDTNNLYELDNTGKVEGPREVVKDENAGDITKGGLYDGSKENPYQIACIEDLVAFSIMTNGGNSTLGLKSNKFTNKYVELIRNLDFKTIFSYNDYTTTVYGDLNADGIIEDIKTELTKTEANCIGFTGINGFAGFFDGNNNEIRNIYINNNGNAGFFISTTSCEIANLGITGIIKGTYRVGGILGATNVQSAIVKIINCYNKAYVYNSNNQTGVVLLGTGGIAGYIDAKTVIISDCKNYGTVECESSNSTYGYVGVGGIFGKTHSGNVIINSCYNSGKIIGNGCKVGGINGVAAKIYNCYNVGTITNGAGIAGFGTRCIYNCYNLGETNLSGILQNHYANEIIIHNVYTNENISNKPILVSSVACTFDITNAFYSEKCLKTDTYGIKISEEKMKSNEENEESLVVQLNKFVIEYNEANRGNEDFVELKQWKIDNNTGYPTFK